MTSRSTILCKEVSFSVSDTAERSDNVSATGSDLSIWLRAPKERTAAYFPTYAALSRQVQVALRGWVSDWFYANLHVLSRPLTAQPLLLYISTTPFAGKPTNSFTYDPSAGMLEAALSSAQFHLKPQLDRIASQQPDLYVRREYFSYPRSTIVKSVRRNSHAFARMLHVDTAIVEDIVKFATTDLPRLGLDAAAAELRKSLALELARFSRDFDLSERCNDIIELATIRLHELLMSA